MSKKDETTIEQAMENTDFSDVVELASAPVETVAVSPVKAFHPELQDLKPMQVYNSKYGNLVFGAINPFDGSELTKPLKYRNKEGQLMTRDGGIQMSTGELKGIIAKLSDKQLVVLTDPKSKKDEQVMLGVQDIGARKQVVVIRKSALMAVQFGYECRPETLQGWAEAYAAANAKA